ncbi:hypothetical protein JM18_000054 [Phytophthora kernoviae]|uniref:Uncharacterized protein n=2 Tax=Phytophthora kernoviae TaxID=325452 RepID=A0A922ATC7_9STRA|nr:hypothetical protein G195_000822 [Phytophthora kernoviae 00238/432]KAG2533603.1 hypothetical protein JM18_000054 [Phytophthora kernoviae]
MPLHELIDTVDDAVDADPTAELNQSTIARLFMDQWLKRFEADRRNYKSVAVRYEVGFEELQRRTANLPRPNDLITTFCCKILEDLTPHFGPYAPLFRVLSAELLLSIHARNGVPYFALVKHHKRLLLKLRRDKEWREERNDVLADDIDNVYSTFRRFLSECTKYVTYFSNWFGNTPKAIVRKLFAAWKHETTVHRIEKVQKQMQIDFQGLTVVKRQADDLTRQRDVAQADNLTMRSDRKQAEEWAQQLELRIRAAKVPSDQDNRQNQHENAHVAQEYEWLLRAVRIQDEHYANHAKLFSSRMLEGHEVSLVPSKALPNMALQASDGFSGADKGDMSAFTHNAYLHPAGEKAKISDDPQEQTPDDPNMVPVDEGNSSVAPNMQPMTSGELYTPYRANIKHAMTLDGLWHVVKILRLPRDIHVLPTLRDEELVANGYEQLFSPEDLGELFLQLCNEQFLPQIATLGKRVEYFVTHHLPIALQNQSRIRPLMHHSDVKLAIGSHSQTIRIIFRRYCAKERELMTPAKLRPRHTGHGINKYMRMIDWQAFIQDYRLLRARFSMEQAMNVFRNVQEATPGNDDQLELIYSEFCEALVGVAMFYVPDPFMKTATKVTQFLRRYLPLSPDDVHDHA